MRPIPPIRRLEKLTTRLIQTPHSKPISHESPQRQHRIQRPGHLRNIRPLSLLTMKRKRRQPIRNDNNENQTHHRQTNRRNSEHRIQHSHLEQRPHHHHNPTQSLHRPLTENLTQMLRINTAPSNQISRRMLHKLVRGNPQSNRGRLISESTHRTITSLRAHNIHNSRNPGSKNS